MTDTSNINPRDIVSNKFLELITTQNKKFKTKLKKKRNKKNSG